MKVTHASVGLLFCVLAFPAPAARAQVITGNLFGVVKDETQAVLPGATVLLTSEALVSGPSERVTNEKGQFRFPALAPGLYQLEVSLLGFAPYREEGLRVVVGGTVERDVVLALPGVTETVMVKSESPILDRRKAGISTNYGTEMISSLPVRRYSTFDLIKSAPGVSATRPSSGSSNSVSVFGSGVNENLFLIDGNNFT